MIARLVSSVRELAMLSLAELASADSARLRGDCADALRLELDCPQQSLSPAQRAALARLSDALEGERPATEVFDAVRAASRALA